MEGCSCKSCQIIGNNEGQCIFLSKDHFSQGSLCWVWLIVEAEFGLDVNLFGDFFVVGVILNWAQWTSNHDNFPTPLTTLIFWLTTVIVIDYAWFKRYKRPCSNHILRSLVTSIFSNNIHYHFYSATTRQHACRTSSKDGFASSLSPSKCHQASSLKATAIKVNESRTQYSQLEKPRPLLSSNDLFGVFGSNYPLSGCINGL